MHKYTFFIFFLPLLSVKRSAPLRRWFSGNRQQRTDRQGQKPARSAILNGSFFLPLCYNKKEPAPAGRTGKTRELPAPRDMIKMYMSV